MFAEPHTPLLDNKMGKETLGQVEINEQQANEN